MQTEFDYPLRSPFTYPHQGNQVEASFIRLTAPTSRNSRECATLKQAFWRSADRDTSSNAETQNEAEVDIKGQDVIVMLSMSRDVDLADVMDVARHLFTKGKVAKVDGEMSLTIPLIDEMSQDDVEAMLGDYLVNITLASSLALMKDKSSKAS